MAASVLVFALSVGAAPAAAEDASLLDWIRGLVASNRQVAGEELCAIETMSPGAAAPAARETVVPKIKKEWERRLGGEEAAKPYIRDRLVAVPDRLRGDTPPAELGDRDFIARVAADTWKGLAALTDRINGMPINNVRLGESSRGVEVDVGDYAGTTDIGLSLIATAAAYELSLIDAVEGARRVAQILQTLSQLETHAGFHFNFYDTTSLERTSNFISFVDSSWLTAGLMVARMTFPRLYDACTRAIERSDYGFFYDSNRRQMSHGFYVNSGERSPFHYGVLYAESRLGSLIAIGKEDAPEEHWFALVRTFPPACKWQQQQPRGRDPKVVRGHELIGGWYEWEGKKYVPSWGGSMFEALMPRLLIDEGAHARDSLGRNGAVHAEIQRRYARDELGMPVWGLSPSATLAGGYGEYGVRFLGSAGYADGPVTPHAAALALLATPEAAIANLRTLAADYDAYGPYGFYDAVDARTGEVAYTYLTLDQAMSFIAMANYLKDGCVQKRFAADPIMQRALPMLADEKFFE